ncbi:MAG: hypothetical protein FJY29_05410 [Betaproteobacteria bacterium]|nr:hypothetical protein [Betaproteobacteria bacterium]
MDIQHRPPVEVHYVTNCLTLKLERETMSSTVHHWDFFGPEAAKTAEHFKKHMTEFTHKQECVPVAEGFFSAHANHTCYWIEIADPQIAAETKKKMRPQRSLPRTDHEEIISELVSSSS